MPKCVKPQQTVATQKAFKYGHDATPLSFVISDLLPINCEAI